jgi:hypothetical protein
MLHTQKPPEVTLTACRCVAFAWRCAASSGVERSRACLAMDARLNEARSVASVGPTIPINQMLSCARCLSSQRCCPIDDADDGKPCAKSHWPQRGLPDPAMLMIAVSAASRAPSRCPHPTARRVSATMRLGTWPCSHRGRRLIRCHRPACHENCRSNAIPTREAAVRSPA